MCGIIYGQSFNGTPVNNAILQQYDKQKSRGQQGFGVFDGVNNHLVHAAEESRILNWLVKEKNHSELLLMHHRFPTSTINVRKAAHPFTTKKYFGNTEYVLVHNGTINNANELYVKHQEQGIKYHSLLEDLSFNDSEALLWDFALYMEGKQDKVTAAGGIAFICLKLVKGKLEKMYFARNSNPLNMLRTKEGLSLSSEGEGVATEANVLHTWNYNLKRLTKRPLALTGYVYTGYSAGEYTPPKYGLYDDEDNFYDNKYSGYQYPTWLPAKVAEKFDQHLKKKDVDVISRAEIEDLTFSYIDQASGNFEMAYWAIEYDYDDLVQDLEVYEGDEELRLQIRILEKVLDHITNDPEYINEDSISSEWRAIWQQQQLNSL